MNSNEENQIYDSFEYANAFKLGQITGKKIIEAVRRNDVMEVKRLLNLPVERGGLILLRYTATDKNGKTAKQIAFENGVESMINLFLNG